MAATLVEDKVIPIGESDALVYGTITPDTSYPTGGWTIDAPGDVGYEKLIASAKNGLLPAFTRSTQKFQVYRQKDPAAAGGADIAFPEVANAVDLSATAFGFIAIRPA